MNNREKVLRFVVLGIYALVIIVPLSIIVLATFKDTTELYRNMSGLPENFIIQNYIDLIQKDKFYIYFFNSVKTTATSVFLSLFFGSMVAYTLIRINRKLSAVIFSIFAFGIMVPPQVNMIPLFNLITDLDLKNTTLGLIIVNVSSTLPLVVFILTGFMRGISKELLAAAKMDGAGEWKIYYNIILPLSKPSLSATGIFLFVINWNDLLYPLLFITKKSLKTIPLALLDFQGQYVMEYQMLFTGVVVASIPMVIMFVFFQKYFVQGMSAGAVKG